MVSYKGAWNKSPNTSTLVNNVEADYFVGREDEICIFEQFIRDDNDSIKVLHHYGTSGVGKTYLLNAYARLAKKEGIPFLFLDSQDFVHTPSEFMAYLLQLVEFTDSISVDTKLHYLDNCFDVLREISEKQRVVLALDTYEDMDDLDRWFRQVFTQQLPENILIVLAGRKPLKNGWNDSTAWRMITKQLELQDFTLEQSREFLSKFNIHREERIQAFWRFTEGHPLTLSLSMLTDANFPVENLSQDPTHVLAELTGRWLREVDDEEIYQLIYVAALFHTFDQKKLSAVLNRDIPMKVFNDLISLSFIRLRQNGWAMHDLIRDAIQADLKLRDLDYYNSISERIAFFYYKRAVETRSLHDIAQFFFHLRNDLIQSVFFQAPMDNSMYLEPVESYNYHEVEAFFEFKKKNLNKNDANFYNRSTNKSFHYHAPLQHNKKEAEFLGPEYIKKMGYNTTNLLKSKSGETLGISIVVPINQNTLGYLATEPVSRAYFEQLSNEEMEEFNVALDQNAGWYIRHLDYIDPTDIMAQSRLLYNLFTLLLPGGKIITSSPITFFQDLLTSLGFQEVPNVVSYDFGENIPSPTYILDVSGEKFAMYLKQFTDHFTVKNNKIEVITEVYSLTDREKDIVQLILEDKTNHEIASELFIAEITVKKHVSRILKKVNVKNKIQLVKKLLEIV